MPSDTSIRHTGNEELDLYLIEREISGSVISILAYIILIISAYKDREFILNRQRGVSYTSGISPSRLVALSNLLVLISNIILGDVAYKRYLEIKDEIDSDETPLTSTPNLNISNGFSIAIIGIILKTLGSFQRVKEETFITIE